MEASLLNLANDAYPMTVLDTHISVVPFINYLKELKVKLKLYIKI